MKNVSCSDTNFKKTIKKSSRVRVRGLGLGARVRVRAR